MELGEAEESVEELVSPLAVDETRYSAPQRHYLRRLNRLLRLRQEQGEQLNAEGVRLIDRAIYSTYCSCIDLGIAQEGQQLLRSFPVASAGRSES
ncbi:MAG: hypothetical protein ACE5KW_05040 [Dehalococcoidia bacterium]